MDVVTLLNQSIIYHSFILVILKGEICLPVFFKIEEENTEEEEEEEEEYKKRYSILNSTLCCLIKLKLKIEF